MPGLETPRQRARQHEIAAAFAASRRRHVTFRMTEQFDDLDIEFLEGETVVALGECRDNSKSLAFGVTPFYLFDEYKWQKIVSAHLATGLVAYLLIALKDGYWSLKHDVKPVGVRVTGRQDRPDRKHLDMKPALQFPWSTLKRFGVKR